MSECNHNTFHKFGCQDCRDEKAAKASRNEASAMLRKEIESLRAELAAAKEQIDIALKSEQLMCDTLNKFGEKLREALADVRSELSSPSPDRYYWMIDRICAALGEKGGESG